MAVQKGVTEPLDVVISADDRYAKHLEVVVSSSLMNTSSPSALKYHILDGGLSEDSRRRIELIVENFGAQVYFNEAPKNKYAQYKVNAERMSNAAYYRISIPEIFPNDAYKVLYLDCDLVVEGDLLELGAITLNRYQGVAAVQDLSRRSARFQLGIPPHHYFNSGVLLLNLPFWRSNNVSERVRQYKLEFGHLLNTNDQCALNGILWDNWYRLPPEWNQQSGIYRRRILKEGAIDYPTEEMERATFSPKIIHYVGSRKPWMKECPHPLRHRYHHYRQMVDPEYRGPKFHETVYACIKAGSLRHLVKASLRKSNSKNIFSR